MNKKVSKTQSLNRYSSKKFIPDFKRINKIAVAIASLRNQLKSASNIDELTVIAGNIIDLEQQIMMEKNVHYKKLEKEKKELTTKIYSIKKELYKTEEKLHQIDNHIVNKVDMYKRNLQTKIDMLSDEYTYALNSIQ